MRVYLEFLDHHNQPIIRRFADEDEAIAEITHWYPEDAPFAREALFGKDGYGEYSSGGGDTWVRVDHVVMRSRAGRFTDLADRMEMDLPLYGKLVKEE